MACWPGRSLFVFASLSGRRCFSSRSRMAAPLPQSADQPGLNGVLSVLKPAGATSTAVISYIKHILSPRAVGAPVAKGRRSQVKVGHGGTLDKLARGVLVVGIGTGTKQLPTYLASEKLYLARGQLGVETETHDLDPTGKVVWNDRDYSHVTRGDLEAYLAASYASGGGLIEQTPPLFSALKQNGQRLSQLAREGGEVDLDAKTRPIRVYSIEVTEFAPPFFTVSISSGSGFYVRSLMRDIGARFTCGATLVDLVRTRQCGFDIGDEHLIEVGLEELVRGRTRRDDRIDAPPATLAPADHTKSSTITTYTGLPCTRDNVLRVLAVPIEQRRLASAILGSPDEADRDADSASDQDELTHAA